MYFTIDIVFRCSVKNLEQIAADDDVEGVVFKNIMEVDLNEVGFTSVKNVIEALRKERI